MKRILLTIGCATLLALHTPGSAFAGRIGDGLARVAATTPEAPVVAWVHFADRAGAERRGGELDRLTARWPARSLERRRMRGTLSGLEASDLPVHAPYVEALIARGAEVRGTSRWLNAASVSLPAKDVASIARLPFVSEVELVPVARRMRPLEAVSVPMDAAKTTEREAALGGLLPGQTAFYGGSYRQNAMIGAPALHAQGLSGAGVLVCMLDSGFRLTHEVFAGIDVVATRDFINQDTIVDDEPGEDDLNEASHGTYTTAAVAGRKDGTYAGVAFGASVALARTENVLNNGAATETPVEMDYWQFAAEWADSLGADVISSSLGYFAFQSPHPSYVYADMDGETSVVARAATAAARRGITVVVSAGNEGASAWHFITTPADADTVITVGAVDSTNTLAAYSGRGPTADGRIKPDVVAMGTAVLVPRFSVNNLYLRVNGTSLSCPLVAGMTALLLEAHPGWGPFEVREDLRSTALNSFTPNNDIGWGLVQGQNAVAWLPSTTGVEPGGAVASLALAAAPNPARRGNAVNVRFGAPSAQAVVLEAFDAKGRRVHKLYDGSAEDGRTVAWDGRDATGRAVPAGIYWLRLSTREDVRGRTTRIVFLP